MWYENETFEFENGIRAGNAQLIGQQDVQNDYFSILSDGESLIAIIADGVSKKRGGKLDAVIAVETFKSNYNKRLHERYDISRYFLMSIDEINKRIMDHSYSNKMGATLVVVFVYNMRLHFASVGNCGLFLCRENELLNLNDVNGKEIELGKISLKKKDILMLCSCGVYLSLTEIELLEEMQRNQHPYNRCQRMMGKIKKKGIRHQDNATAILLESMV